MEKSLQPHSLFGTATAIRSLRFYFFMKYTTQTRVEKNYCIIEVYRDHEWWLTYDFHLDKLYYDNQGRNIYSDLECKHWGTPENIQEIDNSILKNLLSRNHV